MDQDIREKAEQWLNPPFDKDTQRKTRKLLDTGGEELTESFYQNLAFGTGGMRGIMGVGTNRINKYTLGKNAQGLAQYLKTQFPETDLKVAIAFDCRHNSQYFARIVGEILSANGIGVYLFSDLRPTPELSFAVRHLDCQAGIVLTASHNPPQYNGFKVYWEDGGQLVPPQDEALLETINALDYADIDFDANRDKITFIDESVDEAFVEASIENTKLGVTKEAMLGLNIVFTSLHGTSITLIPQTLKKAGFENVHVVYEQAEPDGDFPTVDSPNPEEPEALKRALEMAEDKNADIVIGTDPDGDRLGVAVRDQNGEMTLLNGNQTMVLMTEFLLKSRKEDLGFKGNEFIASTIVSTPMMEEIAAAYDIECKLGLTGFKWIAKMIKDNPAMSFIGGGEESFGYMISDFLRDKDAVTATLLACKIAAAAKADDSSVFDELLKLYEKYGLYREKLFSIKKEGRQGRREIEQIIEDLRVNSPRSFGEIEVLKKEDYLNSTAEDLKSGEREELDIPESNVLIFHLEDGSRIAARPSGTEPKIKFYVSVKGTLDAPENYDQCVGELEEKMERILAELNL